MDKNLLNLMGDFFYRLGFMDPSGELPWDDESSDSDSEAPLEASWRGIPSKIKEKVVEELDLLTRCRLKICSRSNRKLVNSVSLTIKHVRVGLGDKACLIVFHTGIGESIKLDLEFIRGKTEIKRSIYTYHMAKAVKNIPTRYKDPIELAFVILKATLISSGNTINNILLECMEWESNPLKKGVLMYSDIINYMTGAKFRTKKLMFNTTLGDPFENVITPFCSKNDLEMTVKRALDTPQAVIPIPTFIIDICIRRDKLIRMSNIYSGVLLDAYDHRGHEVILDSPRVYTIKRCWFPDPKEAFNKIQIPVESVTDAMFVKREIVGEIVHRHTISPCGYSMTSIRVSMEHTVDWKAHCPMGDLCANCTDPFEYCYLHDTARRAINEPQWRKIFSASANKGNQNKVLDKLARLMAEQLPVAELWRPKWTMGMVEMKIRTISVVADRKDTETGPMERVSELRKEYLLAVCREMEGEQKKGKAKRRGTKPQSEQLEKLKEKVSVVQKSESQRGAKSSGTNYAIWKSFPLVFWKKPTSWTALPMDIKQKIVEKLELLTRCRLKLCSTSDRKLVYSVPLTISNAKIGVGDDACVLAVHTAIGQFLKLDFELIRGRVVIKKSINSYDMDEAETIRTTHTDLLELTLVVMKALFSGDPNNIRLKVLEFEVNPLQNQEETFEKMKKLLAGVQLKVHKVVLPDSTPIVFEELIDMICSAEDWKQFEYMLLVLTENPAAYPETIVETSSSTEYSGLFYRRLIVYFQEFAYGVGTLDLLRSYAEDRPYMCVKSRNSRVENPEELFEKVPAASKRLNDKLVVKRVVVGDIVFVHSLTPCGYTVAAVHESVEHTVDWGKETCGLAELCIKCCDITTYCHFSDIGRRAINEPKWLNIFEKEDDFKERMDEFRHVVRQKSSISDIVATTLASACS